MNQKNRGWLGEKRGLCRALLIGLFCLLCITQATVQAQEDSLQLKVTGQDVNSPPDVTLYAFGRDGAGNPLDLSQQTFLLRHGGTAVSEVRSEGRYIGGVFTIFLIDVPTGVADQLPVVQDVINQFASSPTMQEQTDAITIYQVGATQATQLLAPDRFYNSVRNLFATPLEAETGATALVDSLMNLLPQIDSLKPDPEMVASLVVISDGTDVVSSQFDLDDVPDRAAALGIPIHTVWLDNQDLSAGGKEVGQTYLQDLAAGSRGRAVRMENRDDVTGLWNLIASFREQYRLRYTMPELISGEFIVQLALADDPTAVVETTVTIANNLPSLALQLPDDNQTITWPDLADPVTLRLQTAVSWLDGTERTIEVAQLLVNDVPQDIPLDELNDFEISITNFVYGQNSVQIAAIDDQGIRAASPPLTIILEAGDKNIPEALAPRAGLGRIVLNLFMLLLAIGLLGGGLYYAQREGWLSRLPLRLPGTRRPRRSVPKVQFTEPDGSYYGEPANETPIADVDQPPALAYLEVLEAVTRVPVEYALTGAHIRLGRSPAQSDICFENDITVSRLHTSMMLEGTHYRVYDEKSTSGTWVNDQKVPDYGIQLTDGDEIHLGAVHLRFHQPQARQVTG